MSTELTPQQTFEQKLEERIRQDIGELMPDEALAEVVQRAIEKSFFEEREVDDGHYRHKTVIPWLVRLANNQLKARVDQQVEKWFVDNEEKVMGFVRQRLDAGICHAVVNAIDSEMSGPLYDLQQKFQDFIDRIKQGQD